jgi:hypothetical protein
MAVFLVAAAAVVVPRSPPGRPLLVVLAALAWSS